MKNTCDIVLVILSLELAESTSIWTYIELKEITFINAALYSAILGKE